MHREINATDNRNHSHIPLIISRFTYLISADVVIFKSNPPRDESNRAESLLFRTRSNYRGCRVGAVNFPPVPDLIRLDGDVGARRTKHARTSRCTCIAMNGRTVHISKRTDYHEPTSKVVLLYILIFCVVSSVKIDSRKFRFSSRHMIGDLDNLHLIYL